MLYRLYQPGDFAPLCDVEELCFEPPLRFSRAYMRQLIRNPQSATWIAEENAEFAGFAIVEWSEADNASTLAYIQTIEVNPDHRRRGIGDGLLLRAEASASDAGAQAIWLHVDAENSVAVRLYESHGYTRQGREEHYYARNRAALVYAKSLKER